MKETRKRAGLLRLFEKMRPLLKNTPLSRAEAAKVFSTFEVRLVRSMLLLTNSMNGGNPPGSDGKSRNRDGKSPKGSNNLKSAQRPEDDRGPWFEFAGHPVHAPLALVAACIVSMLFTTVAIALNYDLSAQLRFSSSAILERGEVWRLFSYVLWNPPTISFALELLMLWWFGRELEAFFGRRSFLKLCAGIVLLPALAGVAAGPFLPVQWIGLPGDFALFVAFATMAPNVLLLFGVSAKWTALIFLGVQVLSYAAAHAWGQLLHSLSAAAFAFGYIRLQQGLWELPQFRLPQMRPKLRVLEAVPVPAAAEQAKPAKSVHLALVPDEDASALASIDPLLEKISRNGIGSLSTAERAQLELAREALLKKESSRP